uniref:fructose-bisphosphatase n=1 Tax=Rhizophora mucronata TaxID=61149 RepID=A0A2P2LM99_RHIMU
MDHAADAHRTDLMTITRYVLNEQSKHPESRGDFTILLNHIVLGCKFVCSAVNKAGLAKLIGLAGETNVQGEEQKKLDVLSNEVFIKALVSSGRTCILVSEEDEEATFVEAAKRGKYWPCSQFAVFPSVIAFPHFFIACSILQFSLLLMQTL